MADFFVTNSGTVVGTTDNDRLILTYNTLSTDVWLTNLTDNGTGSYSGSFDGYWVNDTVFSGIEHFTFNDLSDGDDIINTGDGDDTLNGGDGNDKLNSGKGIDVIDGGAGNDLWGADKSFATTAMIIDLNQPVSTYFGGGSVTNIEALNLMTGSGDDRISGSNSVSMQDTINTGAGDDIIEMWAGNTDSVNGGAGNDRLIYNYNTTTTDVWLTNLVDDGGGSYSGSFDGYWVNDLSFSGIEHFTFNDLSGGNDIINTGNGEDILNGGDGNDTLNSGEGIDVVDGGAGKDLWGADKSFATTAMIIDLNQTSSTYLGGGSITNIEALNLMTGSGDDRISGSNSVSMKDTINTGAGDDIIEMWAGGTDSVNGGAGTDRLIYNYGRVTTDVWLTDLVDDGSGSYSGTFNGYWVNDLSFSGIEHFTFNDLSGGNDIINTGDGEDILNGGDGNDTLNSGKGIDVVDGGAGDDLWGADKSFAKTAIVIDLNKDMSSYLDGGSVTNIEALDLITGSGRDKISGHDTISMSDTIKTGAGRDQINMWSTGTDSVDGGNGIDRLKLTYNTTTNDVLLTDLVDDGSGSYSGTFNGYWINDLSFSGIEHFTFIDLSGGNDIINTGNGNDILKGGLGNDTLISGQGKDKIYGGGGNDMWGGDKSFATTSIEMNLNYGSYKYLGGGVVKGIEGLNLITGSGNDKITGHKTAEMNDVIDAGAGRDLITLWSAGTDTVDGGAGVDRLKLVYNSTTNDVWLKDIVDDGSGSYSGTFDGYWINDLTFTGIEHFTFIDLSGGNDDINTGNGDDVLKGGDGNDTLNSAKGRDQMWGEAGNDTLTSTVGNDLLYGGGGADTLSAGNGKDKLTGGTGDDVLTGGAKADLFIFDGSVDEGSDRITDFGNLDTIRISDAVFADLAIVASGDGSDTEITLVSGTVITLEGVAVATVDASDFDFV